MRIEVNEKIIIKDATPDFERWCQENLILKNPDFYKKQKLGKWTGNTPEHIFLYERAGRDLWLPFGCLRDVWKICQRKELYDIQIHPKTARNYKSNIKLYPYQRKAVEAILGAKNGILVMPCGSGKTQCGLEIISRIGGRALWLTHTQDLLNQSKARAESVLDMIGGWNGTITAGKVNIGTHITFATIQTMARIDLQRYKDCFDVIVVDECQKAAGSPTKVTQFYKVISALSARYKIGLTATPKRADGLERSMIALLGGIVHEVSRQDVEANTAPIKVWKINTGYTPDYDAVLMGDGTLDYSAIIKDMTNNEERFTIISDYIKPLEGAMLVLGNRVEYLQKLCERYKQEHGESSAVCLSGMGGSMKAKEERKKTLQKLNDGELRCVFATYQLAKEGLDVPNLRYVVFATPEKDETTVIQSAGRVGRAADGKEYGTVIDFIDEFGMYKGWAKKREKHYKKIGVEEISWVN